MKGRLIISQIIFIPIIGFFFFMGILTIERGSKNYNDLTFVSGQIVDFRDFVHIKPVNRYGVRHKVNLIAFKLEGNNNEFGITENESAYLKIKNILTGNNKVNAELYYDENGKRIEENISLHIFEISVNGNDLKTIENVKIGERKGTVIFFTLGLLFLLFDIWGFNRIKKGNTQQKI